MQSLTYIEQNNTILTIILSENESNTTSNIKQTKYSQSAVELQVGQVWKQQRSDFNEAETLFKSVFNTLLNQLSAVITVETLSYFTLFIITHYYPLI